MSTEALMANAKDGAANKKLSPRERILLVAGELFYREGIRSVGVDAIAEAAGTNKVTLYRHFGSKDGLICEYLREYSISANKKWNAILEAKAGDPKAQLTAFVDNMANFYTDDGGRGCGMANASVELAQRWHPARPLIESLKAAQIENLVGLCRATGCRDPDVLADELFLLLEGARMCVQSMGLDGPVKRLGALARATIASHLDT